MSRKEWKARRDHVLPGRMEYSKRRLREAGITNIREEGTLIRIRHNGKVVTYAPFTGTYKGVGVAPGRGLEEMILNVFQ